MKRIGLALGGGGARGLAHIKFIQAMDEMGVKPVIISGTSIGAIIGAFYASGITGVEMEEVVKKLGIRQLTKMLDVSILNPSGLVKGEGVTDYLSTHIPAKTFEELTLPLKIVATDFWNRKEIVFESGDLMKAIRGSISVPFIFKPARFDHLIMIDGGAVNPLPMSVIRDQCDILIAIDVSGTSEPPKKHPMPNIFESVMNTFHIMETTYVNYQLQFHRPEIYVKPELTNYQILDFHKDKKIMNSVTHDVKQFKLELKKALKLGSERPVKKKKFKIF